MLDSFPTAVPVSQQGSSILDAIVEQDYLNRSVPSDQPGFTVLTEDGMVLTEDDMVGFDADLTIAAAIFGQSEGHVEFIAIVSAPSRWRLLQDQIIDVLAGATTHTMERDVTEPSVGAGFEFSSPYLYNGLGFAGIPPYGSCADRGDVSREIVLSCYSVFFVEVQRTFP